VVGSGASLVLGLAIHRVGRARQLQPAPAA
jgi:hypothetical protein